MLGNQLILRVKYSAVVSHKIKMPVSVLPAFFLTNPNQMWENHLYNANYINIINSNVKDMLYVYVCILKN